MKFNNGFENIGVELVDFRGDDLAKDVCIFGQHAEFYTGLKSVKDYSPNNAFCKKIIEDIINGRTFPKYALQGHTLTFSIRGISRVCLAQITREGTNDTSTFFCSASSGTRPLTQEQNIPMNIFRRKDWLEKYEKINTDLEELYCEMLEYGIPFMDARYIMPHAQVIDLCYTATMQSFIGSCAKRLDNSIADEINYVYRLMKFSLRQAIEKNVVDPLSKKLWFWLLDKADIKKPSYNLTYLNDFERYNLPKEYIPQENAHNDWRKSQWKMELERIYETKPYLLERGEKEMIEGWKKEKLTATYNESDDFTPQQSIKKMDYYKEHRK